MTRVKIRSLDKGSILLLLYLLILPGHMSGQSHRYPLSTGYARVGIYSKNFVDALSCTFNQAALAGMKSVSAGLYGEKRFALQELGSYQLALCVPVGFGGIGVAANYFGYSAHKETQFGIAYGKSLGKIDIGFQVSRRSIQITGYGKDAVFTLEAGMIVHLSEQLHAGLHLFNPNGSKFGIDHLEKLSSVFTAGLGYEPSKIFFISGEIIKETGKPININAGLEYVFSKKVSILVGIYTASPMFYFGPSFKWNELRIGMTASYHPQLGPTPGIQLVFESKDNEK